jgi:tetratricopeptide (TPR) repeat protein
LYPRDEKLYGELIILWNHSGRADQAINLLNRLPEQALNESDALRLRAQACIQLEHWEEANELVQQLLNTSPMLPDTHRMMGQIHEHYGRWREAAESYRDALGQMPDRPSSPR